MIGIITCGAANGPIPDGDLVVDCRSLPDPSPVVHDLPGTNPAVGQVIHQLNPLAAGFIDLLVTAVRLIDEAQDESLIVLYCSAGWHRAVYVGEAVASKLHGLGIRDVQVTHRDLKEGRT